MITQNLKPETESNVSAWIGLGLVLALSLVSFFLSTRHGIGLGNDSWAFTGPALARLHGESALSLHHPPLFGWLIWLAAAITGRDVNEAVIFIQVAATIALITAVWWQLRRALPALPHVATAAALLTATAFPIIEHEGNLGSDQLGAAFAMWTLGLLARHLTAGAGWSWLGACLVTAMLAFLNRFAAFGLVLSVSTVLWLHRGRPFGRDFFTALGAGFVMVLPCVLFLAGNAASAGRATTRKVVWNGIPWDRIRESLSELSLWFLPNRLTLWPVGVGLIIMVAVVLWLGRGWSRATPSARHLAITLTGFGMANMLFLVAAICLVEFGLALDSRTLLPCVPAAITLGALTAALVWTSSWPRRVTILLTFLFLVALNAHRAASLVASYSTLGRGHLNVSTAQSALADFVHAHPRATFIANDPPYFFSLTRTSCVQVPAEYSILSNLRDPEFEATTAALRSQLRTPDPAYLVVFDITDVATRLPAERLMEGDRFDRVFHDYFVSIYRRAPPHR